VTEKYALDLFNTYIEGWKKKDFELLFSNLSIDCIIIVVASEKAAYHGKNEIQAWVESFYKKGNTLEEWKVLTTYLAKDTAFFEWEFASTIDNKTTRYVGASVVYYEENKIMSMREYRPLPKDFTLDVSYS
jgi:hypothetical protein